MSVERITKAEIIQAIQRYVARTGKVPSLPQLQKATQHPSLSNGTIRHRFGNYANAIAAAGYKNRGPGRPATLRQLFLDWAALTRSLKRIPTIGEYNLRSAYSIRPLIRRCGGFRAVPAHLLDFARKEGLTHEWPDVVRIIRQHLAAPPIFAQTGPAPKNPNLNKLNLNKLNLNKKALNPKNLSKPGRASRRSVQPASRRPKWSRNPDAPPVYGAPLGFTSLAFAPCNEDGVLFLFGALAERLGFSVLRIQPGFPDCEAFREVAPGKWRRVRIEFEFESLNFLRHLHPIKGADIIVCWRHNWDNCPLEVIELSKVMEGWKEKAGR